MLQSNEGQNVPKATFHTRRGDQWVDLTTDEVFKNKTVVLFALPGAFTPTCSSTHLPRYNELADTFRQEGVDTIACLSVNDTFVMNAWAGDQHTENIVFLPDGNGEFSAGMGMLVDKPDLGFGKRSWRYSMLVRNGVIEKMFIEAEEPGDPFQVSDADTMLEYINKDAKKPTRVTLFSKPGCPHCTRAKKVLNENGYQYEEIVLGSQGVTFASLAAVSGQGTTPQIFMDGKRIGTADDLEKWVASKA